MSGRCQAKKVTEGLNCYCDTESSRSEEENHKTPAKAFKDGIPERNIRKAVCGQQSRE